MGNKSYGSLFTAIEAIEALGASQNIQTARAWLLMMMNCGTTLYTDWAALKLPPITQFIRYDTCSYTMQINTRQLCCDAAADDNYDELWLSLL